jgi:hypothetical protein
MINYTTPVIKLMVEGIDLTGYDVYVTLEQGQKELTKSGTDLIIQAVTVGQNTDTEIDFSLTQEESGSFDFNRTVSIQVNWISSGVRSATDIKTIPVMRNLLDEVIA